jgi:hypothetical protein
MVGHFPDGVELHVRNLKWFLADTDYHIYVVSLPGLREQMDINDERLTIITQPTPQHAFIVNRETGFVNFWKWFPAIIHYYSIRPEWFLFMEQDLWFFERFDSVPQLNTIKTFFSEKSAYHSILLDDRVLQPHLWEGTHLVSAAIVNRAIDFKIDFGYRVKSLLDRNRQHYEKLFGGKLSISMWTGPETLSDFALYCALEERVGWTEVEKAVHLQGPELLHRKYPQIYCGHNEDLLTQAQREIPYIDVYTAIAVYYIAGVWKGCENVRWENAGDNLRRDLSKVGLTASEWMTKQEHARLVEILSRIQE